VGGWLAFDALRHDASPEAPMSIRPQPIALVGALVMAIIAGSFSIPNAAANDRVVVVQPGQSLSQIAAAHGVSVERLLALNDIADPNRIYPGQLIRLRAAQRPAHHRTALITHRVAYGETLTGIAARFGASVEALARRNHLANASRIYVGQLLRISGHQRKAGHAHHAVHPQRKPYFHVHIVRYGETLTAIAMRYRVSIASIVVANRLADPSFIRSGQQLRIPGHARSRSTSSRSPWSSRVATRMPAAMAALVKRRGGIRRIIAAEARRQGVPPSFAQAVAWQESGWQPSVVSSAGAIGVMQLLPSTAEWVSSTMLDERVNLWDARSNVRAGVRLLRHYLQRYEHSRPLALAAFYQGQAGTDAHGIYPVSRGYIAAILMLQEMFRH
jgi:LysM repeat protein